MKISVIIDCLKSPAIEENLHKSKYIEYIVLTKKKVEVNGAKVILIDKYWNIYKTIEECQNDFILFIDSKDKIIDDFTFITDFDPDTTAISFNSFYNSFEGYKSKDNIEKGYHYNVNVKSTDFILLKKDFLLNCKFHGIYPQVSNIYKVFSVDRFYLMKNEEQFPVDFVFPYVDGNDPEWQQIFKIYQKEALKSSKEYKDYDVENNYSSGKQRYVDRDMLKYLFRSIDLNLPFIRTVHMIVMRDSQIPSWVDKSKIHIVYHDDFIPKEYLPTFNSNTIEMFLHRIPGLAEHFIYSNDDMYVARKQPLSLWFKDGLPGLWHEDIPNTFEFTGDFCRSQNYKVITQSGNSRQFKVQHGMFPMLKSINEECFNVHKNEILNSISRFREQKNLNQWLWTNYAVYTGRYFNKRRKTFCKLINNESRDIIYNIDFSKYTVLCLNDGGDQQTDEDTKIVHKKMDKIFSKKSRFEI